MKRNWSKHLTKYDFAGWFGDIQYGKRIHQHLVIHIIQRKLYVVYLIPSFSLSPSPVSFDRHLSHFGALYILSRTEPTAFASSAIAPAFSPNITTAPKCNRKPNRNFEIYTTNICFRLSIPFPFFRIVTFSSSQFPFRSIYYYSCSLNPFIPEACVYPNDTLNTKKKNNNK